MIQEEQRRFREENVALQVENVEITSKRGQRKQSAARNLLDQLHKYQKAVLRFLECFAVPFDISQVEWDIQMVKV